MNDDLIRGALSPLRAHDPLPQVDRLVSAGRRARDRRRRGRTVGAVTAVAMAAGVVAAGLPGGDAPPTGPSVLRAAAAAAADQPPEHLTGIRYTRLKMRMLLVPPGGTEAERFQYTREVEYWLRRDGTGRMETHRGEYTNLDGTPHPAPDLIPGGGENRSDDLRMGAELGDFSTLSTDPQELRRQLEAAARAAMGEAREDVPQFLPEIVTHRAIDLLSHASLRVEQRRALLEVLAGMPSVRAVGEHEVELKLAAANGETATIRLVLDAGTGAVESWTMRGITETIPGGPERVEATYRFVESRDVEAVGDRP